MPPIRLAAIAIAFASEWLADFVIARALFVMFAQGLLTDGMTEADFVRIYKEVVETTAFIPWAMVLGSATTVGGGYLAARIARRVPYYHGLAMGVVGVVYILALWEAGGGAIQYFGLLSTIPLSILGAHFALKAIPPEQ